MKILLISISSSKWKIQNDRRQTLTDFLTDGNDVSLYLHFSDQILSLHAVGLLDGVWLSSLGSQKVSISYQLLMLAALRANWDMWERESENLCLLGFGHYHTISSGKCNAKVMPNSRTTDSICLKATLASTRYAWCREAGKLDYICFLISS